VNSKRWIALAVLAAVAAVVVVLVVSGGHREWTTSSPAALAAFTHGIDELDKVYRAEARTDFAKAVELDPSFLAAKLFLYGSGEGASHDPEAAALLDSLAHADLAKLTDRERFLIQYTLARHAKDTAKAEKILQAYAAEKPDDPYALNALVEIATARQDWGEARHLLTRLIEVAPNRVSAYNQLGYLAMGQGQFAEARKMFETYRYIAPDQANPHDSIGELDILTGRYAEARKELEDALRIKPDFCASSGHMVSLALLQDQPGEAHKALAAARSAGGCTPYMLQQMSCMIAVWTPLMAANWEGVWQADQGKCGETGDDAVVLGVWAALRTGRAAEADARIAALREKLAAAPATPDRHPLEAEAAHLEGARLFLTGHPADAAERFRFADRALTYRDLGSGLFKLLNRYVLAAALKAAGANGEAAAVLAEARAVNADFVDRLAAISTPAPAR
jgi:Tetratricopeptide repeat